MEKPADGWLNACGFQFLDLSLAQLVGTTFSLKFIDVMSLLLTSVLARALRRSAKPNHGSRCRNCRA
jgi:hypothetical protein